LCKSLHQTNTNKYEKHDHAIYSAKYKNNHVFYRSC
jgi:hypothetical protein